MSKKALIIVGLAAVIAASAGIVLSSGGNSHPRSTDGDPAASTQSSSIAASDIFSDDASGQDYEASNTVESIAVVSGEISSVNSDYTGSIDNDKAHVPTATYSIKRVVEHNSGDDVSPQLVFGKYFGGCYLTLYSDSTAEICLNPSTGTSEKGSYSISDSVMSIDFGKDRAAEYNIVYGDNGIENIIVGSGEYDVYFG